MASEGESFIRDAASMRGIEEDIALRVADSEGGREAPGNVGRFPTGWSWWQFQLHYGGLGYEHYGTVAGMGNGFTQLTGWEPGDDRAWRDACRYALNRAKNGGWTPWYGAAHVGIGKWDGINRDFFWDANAEQWDFEGALPPPTSPTFRVTYNRNEPPHPQNRSYDCSQESIEWAMYALGRAPSDDWMESAMISEGVMTPDLGCTDRTGAGLASFIRRHYGEYKFDANNETNVSWAWITQEGAAAGGAQHSYPVLIGGESWYHWAVCRDYDPNTGLLLIANSANGWGGISQTMTEEEWGAKGPFNAVRVFHPDLFATAPEPPVVIEPPTPPVVITPPPVDDRMERIAAHAEEILNITEEKAP